MDPKKTQPSRRDFLSGAAVTAVAVAGGGALAGKALMPTSAEAAEVAANAKADETIETQVVVVGSGLGGLSTAITAVEEGAKKVVLLEKESFYGGGTNFAEVFIAPPATEAEARRKAAEFMKASNYVADPMLHYTMAIDQQENSGWLFDKHKVKTYVGEGSGLTFYEGGHGKSCIDTLVPQAKALGVDMRLNTQAISLLMKDPYTCIGLRAKTKAGKIIDFRTKGVVLATGGMSTNKALLAKYTSIDLEKVIIDGAQAGQDGDGHLMAESTAHGRATHLCVSSLFLNVKGFAFSSPLGACAGMQPTNLWVNQDGIRFTDESIVRQTTPCNKAVEIQGSVFSIMDQSGFDKYAAGGCQTHYTGFADKLVGQPIPNLAADFAKYKDLPDVFFAQTLQDLAEKMGVDAATFKATVERYNGFAQSGTDAEWGKNASNIWPIAKGPFYGFRLSSGMPNTNGGVRINTNAQVVDPRHKVISGLYATGILTSGWEGETYLMGTCQPVALWGGRKAAKHIVANLL
ncbi:FAD-binding protein [Telmatospirillum siberiense]|uniref:FAD-dependent oxidoreductase n=1 Tax=Telmatospirillum siberiense TaxID=382514 RepID=UPI0013046F35|nr:FAD-binding protein [Telmatospirillum siberiense]